jgi:hypothetical protein
MPRIKVDYQFPAEVIDCNKPTRQSNGDEVHWYSPDTVDKIVNQFKEGKRFIIQEFNPVERQLKRVPLAEVWEEQVMGHCIAAENVNGRLIMTFKCESNKHGKKLMNICESYGVQNLKFYPVGEGITVDVDGKKMVDRFKLHYVAFEG